MVESRLPKPLVAGSIPVSRSILRSRFRRTMPAEARGGAAERRWTNEFPAKRAGRREQSCVGLSNKVVWG